MRLQPHMGLARASSRVWETTSGGVVWGWDLWIGGRSLRPSMLFCGGHVDVSFRMGRRLELRSGYAFAPFQPHLYTTFPLSRTKANRTTRALNCRSGTRCRARHVSCAGRVTNRKADRQTVGADREVRPSGRQPRRWQPARQPGLIIRVCGHGVDAASCFTASPAAGSKAAPHPMVD